MFPLRSAFDAKIILITFEAFVDEVVIVIHVHSIMFALLAMIYWFSLTR